MDELIKLAEELSRKIRDNGKQIDNPAMVMSVLNELEFFIENISSDDNE